MKGFGYEKLLYKTVLILSQRFRKIRLPLCVCRKSWSVLHFWIGHKISEQTLFTRTYYCSQVLLMKSFCVQRNNYYRTLYRLPICNPGTKFMSFYRWKTDRKWFHKKLAKDNSRRICMRAEMCPFSFVITTNNACSIATQANSRCKSPHSQTHRDTTVPAPVTVGRCYPAQQYAFLSCHSPRFGIVWSNANGHPPWSCRACTSDRIPLWSDSFDL